jgi:excisionase family DNA binding protein
MNDPAVRPSDNARFRARLSCTVREACDASGLGPTTIYALIADKTLESTRVGRRRLILVRPGGRPTLLNDFSENSATK